MRSLLPRSKRLRKALLVAASVLFVAGLAAVLVRTADSGTKAKKRLSVTPKAGAAPTTKALTLAIGPVSVQSTGPPAAIKKPVRTALLRATQQYFDDAIQAPIRHGRVDVAYTKVFDPGVKGPAAGRDRAALTESATGVIRGPARMSASPVRIDGLGDPTGNLALAATTFTVYVKADTPTGPLTILRHTELTFANEFGRWVVTAYRATVQRTIGPKANFATAHSGTGA